MRCIFCLLSDPPTGFTEEHVFPEAVGGTLVIHSVCKACNDRLGHSVDVTVTNHTLVAMKRQALGISGKRGAIPNPFERGFLKDDPTQKVRFQPDASKPGAPIYALPSVQRVQTAPGVGTLSVRIDATDAEQLGQIVNTALARAGAPPISEEEIEKHKKNVTRTENPVLSIPLSFDVSQYRRGLMKIVYELACHWIGDEYVDDPTADPLRQFIFDEELPFDPSTKHSIHGTMRMAPKEPFLPFWPQERNHLMACLLPANGSFGVTVSVLGVLEACVTVTSAAEAYPDCQPRFISIDPTTGARRECPFAEEAMRIELADGKA